MLKYLFLLNIIMSFNTLIDKSGSLEKVVAQYILDKKLINIDYQNNDRINYYVNYDIANFYIHSNKILYEYKIVKSINKKNDDIEQLGLVVKNFSDNNTKYTLIKNAK